MKPTSSNYKWLILAIGSIFHFTFTAAWIFVPLIEDVLVFDLGLDALQIAWIYSIPILAIVIFVFLGGVITDKIGVRNATILSGVLITGFGMLRGLSNGFVFLMITSFFFGVGGGLFFPSLAKIVADWFEDKQKGTASGIYLMAGGIGQVYALSITAAVLLPLFHSNWRFCFIFYGIFSLVITIIWSVIVKEKESLEQSQTSPFSIATIKRILRNKYILGLCVIIFFAFSMLAGLTNYMGDLVAEKGLVDPIYVYLASILSLGTTIGNITFPSLSDKIGRRKVFLIFSSVFAILSLSLIQLINIGVLLWFLIFFLGLMVGTLIPLCLTICLEVKTLPEELAGTVSGLVLTFGFFGGFTVSLIFGAILISGSFLFCILYLISFGIAAFFLSFLQKK